MASSREGRATTKAKLRRTLVIFAATISLALSWLAAAPARAADSALSEADQTCLACHSNDGLKKNLADGAALSLHIPGDGFAKSVHAPIGCGGCHIDVKLDAHPDAGKKIKSARDYSLAMVAACRACHEEVFKRQEGSVHAALLRQGNAWGPVCTDCHGSHTVTPRTAYDTCVGCHASAMDKHQEWLPNAGLHLEIVSCAACHAPGAKRMVDLRLYDNATKTWVAEPGDRPYFEQLARSVDKDGNGLDAAELRSLMTQITPDGAAPGRILRGRIELLDGVESHQLTDHTHAIKECTSCHRQGAEPFENVSVSIVSADGKPLRYKAHKEVLSSALSVESLREFYAVGGTRNVLLDVMLLLAVVAGISVPVGHQALKWVVRRRSRDAGNGGPAEPRQPSQPSSRDHGDDTPP
jgi:mono/diheme cytochrome c family protein